MKKMIAPLVTLVLGIGCIAAFNLIGAEVTADGQIIEPFFLIPTGALLIIIGVIWGIIALIKNAVKAKKEKK